MQAMHWDDLELLRLVDELEQTEPAALSNGLGLMQRIGAGEPLDPNRDFASFARELLLAMRAGFLTYDDRFLWPVGVDPLQNANSWLQQVRDIGLTLAGRDRARGRLVIKPLPNPDEDDDRPIAGMTLEEIARAIGNTYKGSQLPKFLLDSGIPEQWLPSEVDQSKWAYVLDVFDRLHEGGAFARRYLRLFLGRGWGTNSTRAQQRTFVAGFWRS